MASDRLVDDVLALYQLIRRSSHPVHRAEMTPEKYWLLRLLKRSGGMSISQLAEALGITGSSVTTACKKLEQAGLVSRERQADDERMVRVTLTAQGLHKIEEWQQQRREFLAHVLAPLDQREQEELHRLLGHMLEAAGALGASVTRKE